jgi:hypothetical protein
MNNIKFQHWMQQPTDEEEPLALITYRPGVSGRTCRETILKRIVHEISNLSKQRGNWDEKWIRKVRDSHNRCEMVERKDIVGTWWTPDHVNHGSRERVRPHPETLTDKKE